jgi:hypothetical protein
MPNGDQIRLTMVPEPTLGSSYYRIKLYTYPAFDLSVANTVEEYIVNSTGTESWPWGNLSLTKQANSYVSLTTNYTDGTVGVRTVKWSSGTSGSYFSAFSVPEPDPTVTSSFVGYRYEESNNALPLVSGMRYSSNVAEQISGKGAVIDAIQYYTETDVNNHSGVTYVLKDKKRKWSVDTKMVTRMQEDTSVGSKKIRSVVEVGTSQYYIDKVDISLVSGKVVYSSTHDVYNTALPRGVNANANSGNALDLTEDSIGAGTFTGIMEEIDGNTKTFHDVTVNRDNLNKFIVKMKFKSRGPKSLGDQVQVEMTQSGIATFSISLPDINGTFTGSYEQGNLFGKVTTSSGSFDVEVVEEGVAVNDQLFTDL